MLERAHRAAAALAIGFLLVQFAPIAAPETDAERELEEVREKIAELQRNMRRDTDRRDALSGQLRDAEQNVRSARGRLTDVRKRLDESDARLRTLAAER